MQAIGQSSINYIINISINYIQTGLLFSSSETEKVQLIMKVNASATKIFFLLKTG